MKDEPLTAEHGEAALAVGMDRRQFMARAALFGLTAATAPVFIAVTGQTVPPASVEPFPDPTPFEGFDSVPFSQLPDILGDREAPLDEASRVSHLLWRAGFGASPGELAHFRELGLQATIDHLVDFDGVDDTALEERLAAQELDPEPEVIERLADVFRANGTEIRPVVRAMLESDEFYSSPARTALVKSPVELAVGAVRALGIETDFRPLDKPIEQMGQALFMPPNVAGWPGGATWINSSALLQRINMAAALAEALANRLWFAPQSLVNEHELSTSGEIVDFFDDLLLGGRLDDTDREVLTAFLDDMDGTAVSLDQKIRNVVYLMLASPGFQVM